MDEESQIQPIFRATKRRKVLRKRANSDASVEVPEGVHDSTHTPTKGATERDETSHNGFLRLVKKNGLRKHGIGFTSGSGQRTTKSENEETSLELASEVDAQESLHSDRFVRPTGRVAVAENKHMIAYIDSKMAEKRPSAVDQPNSTAEQNFSGMTLEDGSSRIINELSLPNQKSAVGTGSVVDQRTYQQAQARSSRVYQRPTKRRPPPQRDQTDVARDSIIDQIMHESQVPHYERTLPQVASAEGEDIDNDAATAEAFKAQLLVELEQQQKRRKPLPGTNTSKTTTTSTGPKLGGSRNLREKMKAMEEAKTATGKR